MATVLFSEDFDLQKINRNIILLGRLKAALSFINKHYLLFARSSLRPFDSQKRHEFCLFFWENAWMLASLFAHFNTWDEHLKLRNSGRQQDINITTSNFSKVSWSHKKRHFNNHNFSDTWHQSAEHVYGTDLTLLYWFLLHNLFYCSLFWITPPCC